MTRILLGITALLALLQLLTSDGKPDGLTVMVMLLAIAAVLVWYRTPHVNDYEEDDDGSHQ